MAYVALLPQVYKDQVDCFKRCHQRRVVLQIQSDATMICISEAEDEMEDEVSQSERGEEDDTFSDIPRVGVKREAAAMSRPIEKRAKRC